MREILHALKAAQQEGLVHRDLRAENILIKQKMVGMNIYDNDKSN